MSNYTLAVNWSGKDGLSDSDAAKVISGADFNTEFTTVRTALNSKADLNGSATESFSATTASAGTNTTQVATTAFVTATAYPVGSIFTTVTAYANSAAVAAVIGGTTWVSFSSGRMLVGHSTGDADFDTVEETGGAKVHTLTTAQMPSHSHNLNNGTTAAVEINASTLTSNNNGGFAGGQGLLGNPDTATTGGGGSHNNMPPYIVVYMWKRTA